MNDYLDLPVSLEATEIDWITIKQFDAPIKADLSPKSCKNETLRLELRKSIQKNVRKHCVDQTDKEYFARTRGLQ